MNALTAVKQPGDALSRTITGFSIAPSVQSPQRSPGPSPRTDASVRLYQLTPWRFRLDVFSGGRSFSICAVKIFQVTINYVIEFFRG